MEPQVIINEVGPETRKFIKELMEPYMRIIEKMEAGLDAAEALGGMGRGPRKPVKKARRKPR